MKKTIILSLFVPVLHFSQAQYISDVRRYVPAPGQFINAAPWGWPASAESIKDDMNGALSLGAYGGYVIFTFEEPVQNNPYNPYGVDFTIFGNAIPGISEPGIVWVMKDENNNDLQDDTWYELAGSDYYFSGSRSNYEVTYFNPMQITAADVPWSDNLGDSGFIYANSFHTQPYYPLADSFYLVNEEQHTYKGSAVSQLIDSTDISILKSPQRAFGYADNHPRGSEPYDIPDNPYTPELENSGGDAFDISWAVDTSGNYVDLDEIDFVKVQTACIGKNPLLGEISTEISGAVDIDYVPNLQGPMETIVIKHLPMPLKVKEHQLEVVYFSMGRPVTYYDLMWEVNMPEAYVDENKVLHVSKSGELQITARVVQDTAIKGSISTYVDLEEAGVHAHTGEHRIPVFPNPAKDYLQTGISGTGTFQIIDMQGREMISSSNSGGKIDISYLEAGLYIIRIRNQEKIFFSRFIKE